MSTRLNPIRTADDVFEFQVTTPAAAQNLASTLRAQGLAEDVVAGLDRVAVKFKPVNVDAVEAWLHAIAPPSDTPQMSRDVIEIGIHYGGEQGPDLDEVCTALGLSRDAFIAAHTGGEHQVEMIGFTPGFSYISGLPDTFAVPRLSNPRPRVPAGSVGISAAFTGIYSLNGPGGWPLIGRTPAPLFQVGAAEPFLLSPGQRVKFTEL